MSRRIQYHKSDLKLVAVDDGNGYVKHRSMNQGVASFPAVYSEELSTLRDFQSRGLSASSDFVIELDGRALALGDTVLTHGLIPVQIAHHSRIETEFYRIMFAGALSRLYKTGGIFRPVVSLPPLMYFDKEKVIARLAGEYKIAINGQPYSYHVPAQEILCIPEGFGAAMCSALDKTGNLLPDNRGRAVFHETIGIVDVGTFTTDFLQLDQLKPVRKATTSLAVGLKQLHENLRVFSQQRGYNMEGYQTDMRLQQGWFPKAGERISFAAEKAEWAAQLATAISGRIREVWNGGDDVAMIVLAGGGAPYVADHLAREFPHIVMPPADSWLLNCEGAFRYGRFMQVLAEQGN